MTVIKPPFYGLGTDGYLYGRIFKSSINNGQFVIDTGEIEYPVSEVEVWDGDAYSPVSDLEQTVRTKAYGGFARIEVKDDSLLKRISPKKLLENTGLRRQE